MRVRPTEMLLAADFRQGWPPRPPPSVQCSDFLSSRFSCLRWALRRRWHRHHRPRPGRQLLRHKGVQDWPQPGLQRREVPSMRCRCDPLTSCRHQACREVGLQCSDSLSSLTDFHPCGESCVADGSSTQGDDCCDTAQCKSGLGLVCDNGKCRPPICPGMVRTNTGFDDDVFYMDNIIMPDGYPYPQAMTPEECCQRCLEYNCATWRWETTNPQGACYVFWLHPDRMSRCWTIPDYDD